MNISVDMSEKSKRYSREPTEADHEVLAELTNFSEKLRKDEARFCLQYICVECEA